MPNDHNFIKTREVYNLGRANSGQQFSIGEPYYIALNPTNDGRLILYAGREEENKGIVFGELNKLEMLINAHRKAIEESGLMVEKQRLAVGGVILNDKGEILLVKKG